MRIASFETNVASLWRLNREAATPPPFVFQEQPECLLFVRPRLEVETHVISRASCEFLRACLEGATLHEAALRAGAIEPSELSAGIAQCFRAGAFAAFKQN